ncbi:MAG: threonine ammonia-lyase [Fusobacteriaceae bacterium]
MSITVNLEMIKTAQEILKSVIRKTPMINCLWMSEKTGNKVYFKMENLQKTGSFKIRGAVNKIANLTNEEKKRGIIASSAGNHAQGVALGAKAQGIKATIVMPSTAPMAKVTATKSYGAEVILWGEVYDDAYNKACEIQKETEAVFIHPFDDDYVIAGQGTIGLEILEELPELEVVVVPIGGGGILSGIAIALKSLKPSIRIIGVQTANVPSMQEALKMGYPIEIKATTTIADGIAVKKSGNKTFEIIKKYIDEIITVSEDEIADAVLYMMEKNKVMTEGAGAIAAAGILSGKIKAKDKNICGIISGGNIDINLMDRIINRALFNQGRRYEFKTRVQDKTGELQKFLDVIKDNKANILSLDMNMFEESFALNTQEIKIIVECFNCEHKKEILNAVKEKGYLVY